MTEVGTERVTRIAKEYYDSADADSFYFQVWGGEDIHIGIYREPEEEIEGASRRTVEEMASRVVGLRPGARVLDCGSGYGGAARHLARKYGVKVECLNLSGVQNTRNRALTAQQGLAEQIRVIDGAFEDVPLADSSVDVVWSQDAILHSGRKQRVFEEIFRVCRPGAELVMTDPMQADSVPDGVLQPVLARIHLEALGSFALYRELAERVGFRVEETVDLTPQLVTHYRRVRETLRERRSALLTHCSAAYLDRMDEGLGHWVDAGSRGHLAWGILRFSKPA